MSHATRVHELVAAIAAESPAAIAVAAPDGTLTYSELGCRSDAVANRLVGLGVVAGTAVGLCLPRSAALVVASLGVLKAGGVYVALDPTYPAERLAFMLEDCGAAVVVTDQSSADRVRDSSATVLVLGDGGTGCEESAPPGAAIRPSELAYIVYTSGSTGRPKGVLIDHAALLNLVRWHCRAFGITAADRGTQVASPGFDAVVWETWPYLAAGASIHIPPQSLRTDPAGLRDWLIQERITISFVPTALAEAVLQLAWPADPALRFLLTGGDALHRRPGGHIPFVVVNNYGPAEATVVATSGVVRPADGPADTPTIGCPIDGVHVEVVDGSLVPVARGVVGELLVGGAGVARGYVNRPELTAERFVPDVLTETGRALKYRTGDLVRMRPDGELEFIGRADEQVKLSGRRIELGEISATLDRHPAVRASAVVAIGDSPEQKRLVACVVLADGAVSDTATLRAHLAASLPGYMVPAQFAWLGDLPLTPADKVDKAALRALLTDTAARAGDGTLPRNELEQTLAVIVGELMGLASVGVDQDFFLLGGHSLLGAQIIARIGDRYGVELALRDLFERPTIADMATAIERLLVAELDAMSEDEARKLVADADLGALAPAGL